MTVLTYALFAAALPPLFVAPGWLWLRRAGLEPLLALYAGFAASAFAFGLIVALGLLLPWGVATTCAGGLAVVLASAAYCGVTAPRPLLPERGDLAGIVIFLCAFATVAAFTGIPSQPAAVWGDITVGPGRVDSPRWPGLSVDNTLPYRTGQIAFHKLGGEQMRDKYSVGHWVSDRTPLTGLAFTFTAGAFDVTVPKEDPTLFTRSQVQMEVKDRFGFWAFNLVALLFGAASVLGAFLLGRVFFDRRIGTVTALVLALAPGAYLHTIYTRPVMGMCYFVLLALALAIREKTSLAGAAAAMGFLVHPGASAWAAAVAFFVLTQPGARGRMRGQLARFAIPAVVVVIPWFVFTTGVMHAQSRLTTAPLNYYTGDPRTPGKNWEVAWKNFRKEGLLAETYARAGSFTRAVAPTDFLDGAFRGRSSNGYLEADPDASYAAAIGIQWLSVHGSSLWGMVGLGLFFVALVQIVRRWGDHRRLWLGFGLPGVLLTILASGHPLSYALYSWQPLIALMALGAAFALTTVSRRTATVVLAIMAFELLTIVYGELYAPFNIGAGTRTLLIATAFAMHAALFAALAAASGTLGPRLRARFEAALM